MLLKRTRVNTHFAVLLTIISQISKAERLHSDTNFYQCLEQNKPSTTKLGEEHRNSELTKLKTQLKKLFPQQGIAIQKKIDRFIAVSAKDPKMQTESEELAHFLNQIHGYSKDTDKKTDILQLWKKFNNPESRSSLAIGKSERCIQGKDPNFEEFIKPLKVEIRRLLHSHPSSRQVLSILDQVSLQPAGSKTFFGATADYQLKTPRICINPEEAAPLLIPKLIHELTHAKSSKLKHLNYQFTEAASKWQNIHLQKDQAEADLHDFEDLIKKDYIAKLETDTLVPQLESKGLVSYNQVFAELAKTAKDNPYQTQQMIGRRNHTMRLAKFMSLKSQSDKLFERLGNTRAKYDSERFLDEHRAYLQEYLAAVHLVHQKPEIFCKIWVPSHAQKRPVRFFEAYIELEGRLLEGSFSEWLADLYTFKTNSYIATSIYENEKERKIKKNLLSSAKEIISLQLKKENLKVKSN